MIVVLLTSCAHQLEHSRSSSPKHPAPVGDGGTSNFYIFPNNDLPAQPGVLLRQQPLPSGHAIPGAAKGIRVLYSSTDGLNGAAIIAVSGSIFLPEGTAPARGWPVMIWSHGTVGVADHCAPSWTGYVPFHREYLAQWLNQGYAVVASDYQGLGTQGTHPYLATQPAAYSNLDIARAAKSLNLPLAEETIVVGQSQGAGAAIATAGHGPTYAPDIILRAVVATGVPYFSPETLIAIQQARPRDVVDPMLGYNFLALTLVEMLVPEFSLADYVYEAVLPTARAVSTVCNRDMRKRIQQEGLTYNTTFRTSPEEPLAVAFASMGFPNLKLALPVFLGTGSTDRDTPPKMQAKFAADACAAGTRLQAHLYEGFDHLSVLNHSTVHSIPFANSALKGESLAGNCSRLPY